MYEKVLFQLGPTLFEQRFLKTDIGKLYQAIPWDELAGMVPPPMHQFKGLGCKPWFDVKGGIALQFLKKYLELSDAKLIERINTDFALQRFCGIQLKAGEVIRDRNLPGWWRSYLGQYLDIQKWQKPLAAKWKPYMQQTESSSQDATCYESRIAFPTDVKLLWQACREAHQMIQEILKQHKQRRSRSNYRQRKKEFVTYQRQRKKTARHRKKLVKKLLKYLLRLLKQLNELCAKHRVILSHRESKRLVTIRSLYEQQFKKTHGEKIEHRIVSISKDYIRPIIRGKETRPVEFGAKVNKLQVDGISFMEHLSYEAFNEGNRLQSGIRLHHDLFGKCKHVSADAIYATNDNRTYCRRKGIITNFVPKGKQKTQHVEQAAQMRSLLNRERTTRMEGSFGNEKNHYQLNKVNARNQTTETCWIFFGIHTANAVIIAHRMDDARHPQSKSPPQRTLRLAA